MNGAYRIMTGSSTYNSDNEDEAAEEIENEQFHDDQKGQVMEENCHQEEAKQADG